MIVRKSTLLPWQKPRSAMALPRHTKTVSEWAADHRVLIPEETSEPGPWSNTRTPYLAGIMDACGDPGIDEIIVIKAPQLGVSEGFRNSMGFWIDQDPGSVLFVMPTQKSAEEIMLDRIGPMIKNTEVLQEYRTGKTSDENKNRIKLSNMFIHAGWAGSATSLATRPCRYVVLDETAKYPEFTGKETDPVSLARKRLKTWRGRSKLLRFTTPTNRHESTWKAFDKCPVKLHYYVPCPHCNEYQVLNFNQIKWEWGPKGRDYTELAEEIEAEDSAHYECEECKGAIREYNKPAMFIKGRWATLSQSVDPAGNVLGPRAVSRRIAFHLPAFYSMWDTWSMCAGSFIRAKGDPALMMDFKNGTEAMPFEIQEKKLTVKEFKVKIEKNYPKMLIPDWAEIVIAAADTQKNHFWYTLRAWGYGFRSRLLFHGQILTFDDLKKICLDTLINFEDVGRPGIYPRALFIDAGGTSSEEDDDKTRTDQVYQFAKTDPRIIPIRGHGGKTQMEKPFLLKNISYQPGGQIAKAYRIQYLRVDTNYYKDVLSSRIKSEDVDLWQLHCETDDQYLQHMASEHKVLERKGQQMISRWVKKSAAIRNDLWDTEVYQSAGADFIGIGTLPSPEVAAQMRKQEEQFNREATQTRKTPDGRDYFIEDR